MRWHPCLPEITENIIDEQYIEGGDVTTEETIADEEKTQEVTTKEHQC